MKSIFNGRTEVSIKTNDSFVFDFDKMYTQASDIITEARDTAYRQINEALVRRNWMLGKLIAEQESVSYTHLRAHETGT